MLVESRAAEAILGELLLHVYCVLAHDLEVFVLKALRNFQQDQQALFSYLRVRVLQEVDNMFGNAQIQACFNLVRISSLENRPNHSKRAPLACLFQVLVIQSAEALSQRDQLVIVSCSPMHRNQERQRKLVHLFGEDLRWLKRVGDVLDVVVYNWVAALAHTRFGNRVLEDLQSLLMKLKAPVVGFVQELQIFLL